MAYGILKVDTITFTDGGVDKSVPVSGLVQNPTFTGNVTVTGTISGNIIQGGTTVSGVTITGTTVSTTTGNFTSLTGTTATITSGIIASGTAALPSLAILSDPNTGIYSPGADQLAVATNGVERLRLSSTGEFMFKGAGTTPGTDKAVYFSGSAPVNSVVLDSSGRLGIGTSSPAANFQVNAASDVTIALSNSSSVTSGNRGSISCYNSAVSSVGTIRFAAVTDNVGTEIQFFTRPAAGSHTQTMTLDSAGRLGIGTTSPTTKLDIYTGSATGTYVKVENTEGRLFAGVYGTGEGYLATETSDPLVLGTNGTEKARLDTSGRLLVGTSSSRASYAANLEIESTTSAATIAVTRNSADAAPAYLFLSKSRATSVGGNTIVSNDDILGYFGFAGSDGSVPVIAASIVGQVDGTPGANDMPGRLVFSTNPGSPATSPTEAMRINNARQVLIGTTSASLGCLSVFDNSLSSSTQQAVIYARSTQSGDSSMPGVYIAKFANDTTTSQVLVKFAHNNATQGQGQINADGASQAAFGTFSDRRLKENIENLPSQLNNIKALRPVAFDYKDKSGHQIGFVAQEMEQIYPDAIGVGENEMLTVTGWSKTEARLVKALQEAIAKIESLEARLTAAGID